LYCTYEKKISPKVIQLFQSLWCTFKK